MKYACLDIGGTYIKHAVRENGDFTGKGQTETQAWKGGPAILETALNILEGYSREYELQGVCVSTAGVVDVETGTILHAGDHIPGYTGTSLKKTIEERLRIPCEVENDVNCAGLAEAVSGAGVGRSPCLCLTIGTGIGGCVIVDGKVLHGASYSAGEVGYMDMAGTIFQDRASASAVIRRAEELTGEAMDGKKLFELAGQGHEGCSRLLEEMADTLGQGIANIACVINPQAVVLGGGIMKEEAYFRPRIEVALERRLIPLVYCSLRLEFAHYGNDAGMLGAYYHFIQKQGLY